VLEPDWAKTTLGRNMRRRRRRSMEYLREHTRD
jgi:hypothetical protein